MVKFQGKNFLPYLVCSLLLLKFRSSYGTASALLVIQVGRYVTSVSILTKPGVNLVRFIKSSVRIQFSIKRHMKKSSCNTRGVGVPCHLGKIIFNSRNNSISC